MALNKPIEVQLLSDAEEYFEELPEKVQIKFLKSLDKVQLGLKGRWFAVNRFNLGIQRAGTSKILPNSGLLGSNWGRNDSDSGDAWIR